MKIALFVVFSAISLLACAQGKLEHVGYNQILELKGTPYVLAYYTMIGKMYKPKSRHLLFINTQNGDTCQVNFSRKSEIAAIEQVKMDTLGINKVLVRAKIKDLDGKNGIDRNDPTCVLVFSCDGKTRKQLTDDNFWVGSWATNRQSGTITITGHVDSNGNKKHDEADKNEILVYDLRTLTLLYRI